MKTTPTQRLNHIEAKLFRISTSPTRAEDQATNRFQRVPLILNSRPKNRKESTLLAAAASTNCGKNARKNRATFGLSTFVQKPCTNIVRNGAPSAAPAVALDGRPRERISEIPTYTR